MFEYAYALIIAQVLSAHLYILWEFFSLSMRLFGLKTYSRNYQKRSALSDNIKNGFYTSMWKDLPTGLICGRCPSSEISFLKTFYIGKIDLETNSEITIICTETCWDKLCDKRTNDLFDREIDMYTESYGTRTMKCRGIIPKPNQKKIIDSIINLYDRQNYLVAYISGPPGVGKTKLSNLIAQYYKGILFKTSMEHCVQNFTEEYLNIAPVINRPLIVLLDEIDESLDKIFDKSNMVTKSNKSDKKTNKKEDSELNEVSLSKRSWNGFFDDINDGLYPYTIFLMTSNISKKEIDKKNASLLRSGRINLVINMTETNAIILSH